MLTFVHDLACNPFTIINFRCCRQGSLPVDVQLVALVEDEGEVRARCQVQRKRPVQAATGKAAQLGPSAQARDHEVRRLCGVGVVSLRTRRIAKAAEPLQKHRSSAPALRFAFTSSTALCNTGRLPQINWLHGTSTMEAQPLLQRTPALSFMIYIGRRHHNMAVSCDIAMRRRAARQGPATASPAHLPACKYALGAAAACGASSTSTTGVLGHVLLGLHLPGLRPSTYLPAGDEALGVFATGWRQLHIDDRRADARQPLHAARRQRLQQDCVRTRLSQFYQVPSFVCANASDSVLIPGVSCVMCSWRARSRQPLWAPHARQRLCLCMDGIKAGVCFWCRGRQPLAAEAMRGQQNPKTAVKGGALAVF